MDQLFRVLILAIVIASTLVACSSVHLQTGPPTTEERTARSDQRAQGMRADFSRRLEGLEPLGQAHLVIQFIDSATSQHLRYGDRIAEQWVTLSTQQGRELTDAEMRDAIERSITADLPLLESLDDIVDYGVVQVTETRFFDDPTLELFDTYRDLYFSVYGYVYYPNGSANQYQEGLYSLKTERTRLREEIEIDLRRY